MWSQTTWFTSEEPVWNLTRRLTDDSASVSTLCGRCHMTGGLRVCPASPANYRPVISSAVTAAANGSPYPSSRSHNALIEGEGASEGCHSSSQLAPRPGPALPPSPRPARLRRSWGRTPGLSASFWRSRVEVKAEVCFCGLEEEDLAGCRCRQNTNTRPACSTPLLLPQAETNGTQPTSGNHTVWVHKSESGQEPQSISSRSMLQTTSCPRSEEQTSTQQPPSVTLAL